MRRYSAVFAPILLVAAMGCREDVESPTEPERSLAVNSAAAGELSFRQVSVGSGLGGGTHVCGVTTDDRAYCWGANLWGQLGVGTTTGPEDCGNPCSTRPVAVQGGLRFLQVSAGDRYTCGITTGHRVYCWGRNVEGQLGDGTQDLRVTPVPVASTRRFRAVRAGHNHACAITDFDVAFCWGWNGEGELGDETTTQRLTPVRVAAGGLRWRDLSADHTHTCGATTTNRAYCWGGSGPLGDGTTENRRTPTPVFGNRLYDHLTAGMGNTCGVTRAARGFCWGANFVGQLGDGTIQRRPKPTAIGGDLSWAQVSTRYDASCGVTSDDRAYCWGNNGNGQLGDGSTTQRLLPVPVAAPL